MQRAIRFLGGFLGINREAWMNIQGLDETFFLPLDSSGPGINLLGNPFQTMVW